MPQDTTDPLAHLRGDSVNRAPMARANADFRIYHLTANLASPNIRPGDNITLSPMLLNGEVPPYGACVDVAFLDGRTMRMFVMADGRLRSYEPPIWVTQREQRDGLPRPMPPMPGLPMWYAEQMAMRPGATIPMSGDTIVTIPPTEEYRRQRERDYPAVPSPFTRPEDPLPAADLLSQRAWDALAVGAYDQRVRDRTIIVSPGQARRIRSFFDQHPNARMGMTENRTFVRRPYRRTSRPANWSRLRREGVDGGRRHPANRNVLRFTTRDIDPEGLLFRQDRTGVFEAQMVGDWSP